MKKILRLTLFFLAVHYSPLTTLAQQAPVIEWQNTIGGNNYDELRSIQQTSDGGCILGGSSSSSVSGDKTENSIGGNDYWIVKTDASGNIQWQNTIGGSAADWLYSIQQTSDGGYILGGYSDSNISGDKTEDSIGIWDYWMVKTNTTGDIQWQNTIGGSNSDYLYSIQQTSDGGYLLGGTSWSNISGDKTEDSNGNRDYWIVKTDATGDIQWQNTIGGSYDDFLISIQPTSDRGYILGGYSQSNISGDKSENSNGYYDYWIVKIDSSGIIEWQNTIGGNNLDFFQAIEQTSDGGYILGGWSNSNISGDKMEDTNGNWDYWIVKTDASGDIQWQNTIGGSGWDELISIQQTNDGGFILGGYSDSNISGDKAENSSGGNDYWILKTDASGNIQWQTTIGGSGSDYFSSIQQTSDDGYLLGGWSNSNISGDKTEDSNGYYDYWIVKLQGCDPCPAPTILTTSNISSTTAKLNWQTNWCATGTIGYKVKYRPVGNPTWTTKNVLGNVGFRNINGLTPNTQYLWRVRTKCSTNPNVLSAWSANSLFTTPLRLGNPEEETTFNIYPNPSGNYLNISTNNFEIEKIEITNVFGQIILSQKPETQNPKLETQIDVSALTAGVYLLTASGNGVKETKMFVKE